MTSISSTHLPSGASTPSAAGPAKLFVSPPPAPAPAPAAAVAASATAKAPSGAELSQIVGEMQTKISKFAPELRFSIDQSSGRAVIQLTNSVTNEVIQQFPSEAALQISKELDRYQKGRLLNMKA